MRDVREACTTWSPRQSGCGLGHAGYYEDGQFGIRIENLLIIKEAETPFRFGDAPYLSFERLTMCPLQRKMIDLEVRASLLSTEAHAMLAKAASTDSLYLTAAWLFFISSLLSVRVCHSGLTEHSGQYGGESIGCH